jgi:hypothetical protein
MLQLTERWQSWYQPCQEWQEPDLDQQLGSENDEESYAVQIRNLTQYHLHGIEDGQSISARSTPSDTVQDWNSNSNSDDADEGPAKPQSLSATSNGSALIMLSLSFGRATCEPLEDVKLE